MNKHFADWKIEVNGVYEEVEVRSCFDGGDYTFSAIHNGPDGKITLSHTDPNVLKDLIRKRLHENCNLIWRSMLEINLDADFRDIGEEIENEVSGSIMPWTSKMEITVSRIQLSVDRKGKKVHRKGPGQQIFDGWPKEGSPKEKNWMTKDMICVIDDTPRNRAVLKIIFSGMKELHQRFCDNFDPKKIQKTLEAINSGKLLVFKDK